MGKYVKADMIVDRVCKGISCNECSFGTNEDGMSECVLDKRIAELPTADVVEVVRCKNCKHYSADGWGYGNCYRENVEYLRMQDNGYCSFGERSKDNE